MQRRPVCSPHYRGSCDCLQLSPRRNNTSEALVSSVATEARYCGRDNSAQGGLARTKETGRWKNFGNIHRELTVSRANGLFAKSAFFLWRTEAIHLRTISAHFSAHLCPKSLAVVYFCCLVIWFIGFIVFRACSGFRGAMLGSRRSYSCQGLTRDCDARSQVPSHCRRDPR